ncbi:STAS domain-containing protein [Luedemannella helvata]|uniref:STAS domain-containing protein n=1 Tax=Luedemannella helvata TaxID=349315 RepID=A0ABP4XIB6_9ACTN
MESGTDQKIPVIEVQVNDELDTAGVARLTALLHDAVQLRPAELVVDLTDCPFVDAAFIGLLLDTHREIRRSGGLLTLRSPSDRVRRNLRLARADQVLAVTGGAA